MEVIRPAGLNELRCIARDNLKLYGSIISVAGYAGPRQLVEADFIKALKQCIVEHAALAIVVQDADTERPFLGRIDQLDLTKHCYVREGGLKQQLIEDNHNEPFIDCSVRPQWRIVVRPIHEEVAADSFRFHLAFICSHNIADGMSGPSFHTKFLQALNKPEDEEFDGNPLWSPPKDGRLPPPLEKAGKLTISWSFLLGPLLNEYFPAAIVSVLGLKSKSTDNVWKGASARPCRTLPFSLVPTKVCHKSVSAEMLKSALSTCKQHNSRLTGLLTHLTARALARSLKSRGKSYLDFIAGTSINLRKALKCGEGDIANYASGTEEIITVEPRHLAATPAFTTEDWEAVAATTKHLEEKNSTLADQPLGLLSYLNDFRGWNEKNAKNPAKTSFEVSNIGSFDSDAGDWEIRDLVFSQSADASGQPISVNIASTKGGKLNLAFVWSPGALGLDDEDVFVEEVAENVCCRLENLVADGE